MLQEIMPFVSKHPILSLAWIALLVMVIVITFNSSFSKVKEISCSEATRLINKEDAVVVDTRSRDDFRKGHLTNAINLTASEIKSGNLGDLEKQKAQPIIVACANGTASREAADNLNKSDFNNVMILKEGIAGWNGKNLPLVRGK
ncbi:MAG: rhodanese-like domain-containing protein [Serratia symbiotica]|nr:rhodanese-like domain-containing protein [Serratia symbiotica]